MEQVTVGQMRKWLKGRKASEKLFVIGSSGVEELVLNTDNPCEAINNGQTMILPESSYFGTVQCESITVH